MLQVLQQKNIRIGIIQDKKLSRGVPIRYSVDYKVWEREDENRHRGGITTIYLEEAGWQAEGATNYRTNMVISTIMVRWKEWFIIG